MAERIFSPGASARRVPRVRAHRQTIGAEEAARIGLIAECVDDAKFAARAREVAQALAAGPREAFLASVR